MSSSRSKPPSGTVTFPLAYEGPPGIVHGGFLAVFFDSVIQHHNCDVGVAGKTTSLTVTYRRPTPLLTKLQFELERSVAERRISSTGRLMAGELLVIIPGVASIGARLQFARDLNDADGLMAMMIVILVIGIVVDSLVFGTAERAVRKRWGLADPTTS